MLAIPPLTRAADEMWNVVGVNYPILANNKMKCLVSQMSCCYPIIGFTVSEQTVARYQLYMSVLQEIQRANNHKEMCSFRRGGAILPSQRKRSDI